MVIKMTIEEICVLNMALDGKDIFALQSLRKIITSKMLLQSVKKQLIRKKLLENESSFTMKGVQVVKNMQDYKKARKYVKLGSVVIGVTDEENTVALIRHGMPQEYEFQTLDIRDGFSQLRSAYPFLQENTENHNCETTREVEYEKFQEQYALTFDDAIYLSTYSLEEKKMTDEIIFSSNGALCLYDRDSGILIEALSDVEKIVTERMSRQ
jgi:hypothetical protein